MDSYSISEGRQLNPGFADRQAERIQNEEHNKIEQQKVEIQQKQLELQQQRQDTNQLFVVGGLFIASVLVLTIVTFLVIRTFKKTPDARGKS